VSYVIVVRSFTKEEMGVWALFLTVTSIVESVKLGLLRNALVKFFHSPDFGGNKQAVQSSSLVINIGFSLVIIILIILFGKAFSLYLKTPTLEPLLYRSIILVLLQIPFNHCEIVQQSNLKYQPTFWSYFIRQGLYFAAIIIFILFFPKLITFNNLVTLQIISLLVATIYFLWVTRKLLHQKFVYNSRVLMRLLHFGKYVFGTALFSTVARYTNHFITANATPDAALGKTYVSYYNVVSRIFNLIDVPILAAADVLFPRSAQAIELEGNIKVKYYYERMAGILIALILPPTIFILIFPKFFLLIIAGKQYLEAASILQVMILFSLVRPFVYQFGITMDSIGKPQVNFWVNTLLLTLNIVLTYFGLNHFGMMGAAYGSVTTDFVAFCITYIVLRKNLDISFRSVIRYTGTAYKDFFMRVNKVLAKS
jgi:O-antigen/teichoic acid export membrane protein